MIEERKEDINEARIEKPDGKTKDGRKKGIYEGRAKGGKEGSREE